MSLEAVKNRIPEYAKDIKLNLSSISNEETLTQAQFWGTVLASALASGNAFVIREIAAEAEETLSPEAQQAAKAAASIMAMNNIYYRFLHLTSNPEYKNLPAKLRMNVIANPGVDKQDFELWSLAVSAINGCGMCVDAHESELLKGGMGKEQIQTAVRIASVIHAASAVLSGEAALQGNMDASIAA
jgi:alkyl hydroperoxide reductase subunit D